MQKGYLLGIDIGTYSSRGVIVKTNGTVVETLTYSPNFATNTWYHVAVVVDESNAYMYINGSLETSSALSSPYIAGTNNESFFIGSRSVGSDEWHGNIDDVRIYNAALSSDDIEHVFNGTRRRYSAWLTNQINNVNVNISTVNTTIAGVNTSIHTNINLVDSHVSFFGSEIWSAINLTDAVADYLNSTIWNNFTLINTSINDLDLSVSVNYDLINSSIDCKT